MRYRLCDQYRLTGWKGLLTGVYDSLRGETFFLADEAYRVLLHMNGIEDLQEEELSNREKQFIAEFVQNGLVFPCCEIKPLAPQQKYLYHDNPYVAYVHWAITGKCNYRCKHCYMYAPIERFPEPGPDEYRKMIRDMSDAGVHSIALTGGEPLVRNDFMELAGEIVSSGIHIHSIYTNGALVTDKLLLELERLGQKPRFHISYDGQQYHDWLRGIPGAAESALHAMDICHAHGNEVYAAMCVYDKNCHDIFDTVQSLASHGVTRTRVKFMLPNGMWADEHASESLSIEEAVNAVIEFINSFFAAGMPSDVVVDSMFQYNRKQKFCTIPYAQNCTKDRFLCSKAAVTPYIGPTGVMLPCMTLGGCDFQDRFPNILTIPFGQALSDTYYHEVTHMKKQEFFSIHKECADCSERHICTTGCRACATEDYLGLDRWNCDFLRGGHYRRVDEAICNAIAKYCPEERKNYLCFTD